MKFNIEDKLYEIDQAFAVKTQKDILLTYLMIAGGIFFVSFWFFWESSEASYQLAKKQSAAIEKKINTDQSYLNLHPESEIGQIDTQIKSAETQYLAVKKDNSYIKYQIEQISSLYYDEQTWGEYLDDISADAKKYGVKIDSFTNEFAKDKNAFGHVLDIEISAHGNFQNTVKFINALEQSFLVVDVHDMNMIAESKVNTELKISVWGITY